MLWNKTSWDQRTIGSFRACVFKLIEASTLIGEGYLSALVSAFEHIPSYWKGMLRDFPSHPVRRKDPQLQSSLGCTLYGVLVSINSALWFFHMSVCLFNQFLFLVTCGHRWWDRLTWWILDVFTLEFGSKPCAFAFAKLSVSYMCDSCLSLCVHWWYQCDVANSDTVHHQLFQWDVQWWNSNSCAAICGRQWSFMSSNLTLFLNHFVLVSKSNKIFQFASYLSCKFIGSKVCRLWLYVLGFRADWKALVALFNLERHYNTNQDWMKWQRKYLYKLYVYISIFTNIFVVLGWNQLTLLFQSSLKICWLCGATKGNDGDLSMCFTDISHDAAWWGTMGRQPPWVRAPSYTKLVGYDTTMIVPDLLHVWNLGLARELLGSSLKLILQQRDIFTGSTLSDRLLQATESLKRYAKMHRYALRCKKLTKGKLCWKTRKYPSLGVSGYDAFVIGSWLEDLLSGYPQLYTEISSMLWLSNRAISLMYSCDSWFLSQTEKDTLEVLGFAFLRVYMSMAENALRQHKLLFKVLPKAHLLAHIFRSNRMVNPSKYSTWMDEDFLRKSSKTMGLTDARGSHLRFLQRWLMALPGHFAKTLGPKS